MKIKCAGAMVLGMHDALVSLTGLLAGLAFTSVTRSEIILTAIIASVTASLSMGASNYLAHRADANPNALATAFYTGTTYFVTCVLLIIPFIVIHNKHIAMISTLVTAFAIITFFNMCAAHVQKTKFWPRFSEMLIVCSCISIAAFLIGQTTQYFLF